MSSIQRFKVSPHDESHEAILSLVENDGWYRVTVRFDGCIHFERFHNEPLPDENVREFVLNSIENANRSYLHICDLDEMIQLLMEIREKAKEHFKVWPL